MTPHTDLCRRLREFSSAGAHEAADIIEAQAKEIAELRAGLATIIDGPWPDYVDSSESQTRFDALTARQTLERAAVIARAQEK